MPYIISRPLRLFSLVPYFIKTVRKNKKTKNVFDNCEFVSIYKALIPPCGVLDKNEDWIFFRILDMTSSTKGMFVVQKNGYDSSVKRFDSQIGQMELLMLRELM